MFHNRPIRAAVAAIASRAMRDTGADMQAKFKETWRGVLAVYVAEC
jgi:L-serine deaminase